MKVTTFLDAPWVTIGRNPREDERTWLLSTGCETLEQLWLQDLPPSRRVWLATCACVLSARDHRRFACWCCRQPCVWDRMTDPRSRRAVVVAEAFAEGQATREELDAAADGALEAAMASADPHPSCAVYAAYHTAWCAAYVTADSAACAEEYTVWYAEHAAGRDVDESLVDRAKGAVIAAQAEYLLRAHPTISVEESL